MNVGEVIVSLRKQKGIKQKDFAHEIGISATHLSLIENNESKPSAALLQKISDSLDMPVAAIIYKSINPDELTDPAQKKYFKAADPIVNALMNYLLGEKN